MKPPDPTVIADIIRRTAHAVLDGIGPGHDKPTYMAACDVELRNGTATDALITKTAAVDVTYRGIPIAHTYADFKLVWPTSIALIEVRVGLDIDPAASRKWSSDYDHAKTQLRTLMLNAADADEKGRIVQGAVISFPRRPSDDLHILEGDTIYPTPYNDKETT